MPVADLDGLSHYAIRYANKSRRISGGMSLTIATYDGEIPKEGHFLRIPYIICRKLLQYRFWERFLYDEGEHLELRKPELYQNFIDTSHRAVAITIGFTKWDLDKFAPLCYSFIAINYRVQTYQHYEIYGLIYWQNSKQVKNKWRYNVVTTSAANPRIVNSSPWLPTRSAWIKSGERKGLYTI